MKMKVAHVSMIATMLSAPVTLRFGIASTPLDVKTFHRITTTIAARKAKTETR